MPLRSPWGADGRWREITRSESYLGTEDTSSVMKKAKGEHIVVPCVPHSISVVSSSEGDGKFGYRLDGNFRLGASPPAPNDAGDASPTAPPGCISTSMARQLNCLYMCLLDFKFAGRICIVGVAVESDDVPLFAATVWAR
jgi:hypothetical protein